jgi:hypothetical protein
METINVVELEEWRISSANKNVTYLGHDVISDGPVVKSGFWLVRYAVK